MAKAQAMGALLTVLVVVLAISAEMAHAGICSMSGSGLRACRPAAAMHNPTEPSAECCAALKGADLPCWCTKKKSIGMWARMFKIDINRAFALPGKCGVALPAKC